MKRYIALLLTVLAAQLSGCVTTPKFETAGIDLQLTPTQTSNSPKQAMGKQVIWGGLILSAKNLPDATRLEVLAYPLSEQHRPNTKTEPIGRFLLLQPGYLETKEYAEGRYVSVQGQITDTRRGKIDETDYLYPVVKGEKLFLWPRDFEATEPKVHFGIGVIITR